MSEPAPDPEKGDTTSRRGTPLADSGRKVAAPTRTRGRVTGHFPPWTDEELAAPNDAMDYTDILQLHKEQQRWAHIALRASLAAEQAYEKFVLLRNEYQSAFNATLIGISGGDAKTRIAHAELQVEDVKMDMDIAEAVYKRHQDRMFAARRHLEFLENRSRDWRLLS